MLSKIDLPDDFTQRHALVALYALQQWECLGTPPNGPYAPRYFWNHVASFVSGLAHISRKTTLKHLHEQRCAGCGVSVDLTHTIGDHIVPLSAGGIEALHNLVLLCRRCNSSKGRKDFLQWWMDSERDPLVLDRRVLCLYARILWQSSPRVWYEGTCDPWRRMFLCARLCRLPSSQHVAALLGASIAACAQHAHAQMRLEKREARQETTHATERIGTM